MTNKKQTKVQPTSKKVTKREAARIVEQKPQQNRTPKCSVNFVVIHNFEGKMESLNMTRESRVNDIMLALYASEGTNLNPNVLANQIRNFKNLDKKPEDKDYCKVTPNCISWYKNHYNAEQNKFVSTKKKGFTKEQILERLYTVEEVKKSPVAEFLPSLSFSKLKELAQNYSLV